MIIFSEVKLHSSHVGSLMRIPSLRRFLFKGSPSSVHLLLPEVFDNLFEALVGAGKKAQQGQHQNDEVLYANPDARSFVEVTPGDQLDDGWKDQSQSR